MQQVQDTSLYFHEADEVNLKEVDWPDQPMIEGPIVLHPHDGELWASFTQTTVSKNKISEIAS